MSSAISTKTDRCKFNLIVKSFLLNLHIISFESLYKNFMNIYFAVGSANGLRQEKELEKF